MSNVTNFNKEETGEILKKLLLLLCIGAIYNLYFTLINSSLTSWINIIIFIIFGYVEVFALELLFKYSIKFQKKHLYPNTYYIFNI